MVRSIDRNARLMLAIDATSLLSARSTHCLPSAKQLSDGFSMLLLLFVVVQCFSMVFTAFQWCLMLCYVFSCFSFVVVLTVFNDLKCLFHAFQCFS